MDSCEKVASCVSDHRLHSRPASNGSPPRKPSGKKARSQMQTNLYQLQPVQSSGSPTSCSSEQSILAYFPGSTGSDAPTAKAQAPKQQIGKLPKQDGKYSKAQALTTSKPVKDISVQSPPSQFQTPNNSRHAPGKRYDVPAIILAACPAFLSPAPRPDQLPMPPSMLLRKASAQAGGRAATALPTELPSTLMQRELCDWASPCVLQILPAVMA